MKILTKALFERNEKLIKGKSHESIRMESGWGIGYKYVWIGNFTNRKWEWFWKISIEIRIKNVWNKHDELWLMRDLKIGWNITGLLW